jgi:hypothetical protein
MELRHILCTAFLTTFTYQMPLYSTAIAAVARNLAVTTMHDVFGVTPYAWQGDILQHMHAMGVGHLPTAPILLSQPTGGGKSMVRDAYSCLAPGMTLNFAPLLSLNADQNDKFVAKCKDPTCFSVHLDTYKDFQERQALRDLILNIGDDTSVVIFCSPQAFTGRYTCLSLLPCCFAVMLSATPGLCATSSSSSVFGFALSSLLYAVYFLIS